MINLPFYIWYGEMDEGVSGKEGSRGWVTWLKAYL